MSHSPYFSPRSGPRALVTLGAMNFGKRTSPAESDRIMARAIERGVVFIDTANVYNDGESEKIVGKALRGRRQEIAVATKVGLARTGNKPEGLSRATIHAAVDASLARLGTDHVDLYYLHAPDPLTPIEETVDALAELLSSGKIKSIGVSNYASWQILEIMHLCDARKIARPAVSQVIYNLLVRQIEIEYLRFCKRYPLHTTVYNPLAGGMLTDRYRPGAEITAGSRFDKNRMYQKRYWSDRQLALAGEYRALAADAGMTLVELAYAWLAGAPGVDSILVGPGSVEHLDAALDAVEKDLPAEIRARASAIHEAFLGTDVTYAR
jgi:aryl-alcohol dehydrogenase-like predicted oxidoreductase